MQSHLEIETMFLMVMNLTPREAVNPYWADFLPKVSGLLCRAGDECKLTSVWG